MSMVKIELHNKTRFNNGSILNNVLARTPFLIASGSLC